MTTTHPSHVQHRQQQQSFAHSQGSSMARSMMPTSAGGAPMNMNNTNTTSGNNLMPLPPTGALPMHAVLQNFQIDQSQVIAAAKPMHVQHLQKMLDLNPFINQLDKLLSSSIRIPHAALAQPGQSHSNNTNGLSQQTPTPPPPPQRLLLSVNGIWQTKEERDSSISELYNFKTAEKRKWLQDILMEESDTDSDGEQPLSEQDLKNILKIHKSRRKYQKKYHLDIMNSQYTYYSAGLLSEEDRFPKHQQYVIEQYGLGCDVANDASAPIETQPPPGYSAANHSNNINNTITTMSLSSLASPSSSVASFLQSAISPSP